jgi:two-component system, OmpR family, phosphate regulon sensor histidine kinase PhoR
MPRVWLAEVRRLVVGAFLLAGVGFVLGAPGIVVLLGAAAYLGWHLFQIFRLERWLDQPEQYPPPEFGIWHVIYQKLAHQARRNSRYRDRLHSVVSRFEQASEAAPDGAIILREDGSIDWLNNSAVHLLGLRRPQDVGLPIVNLVRSPAFGSYLDKEKFNEPLQMDSPADERIRLQIRVVRYGDDQKLMLVRDVTRLHRLEEMRRDFVANVSHELRSPLTVIMGYLETLGDDGDTPPSWKRPVSEMNHQAQRMHEIVEDLLSLSRIEHDPGGAPKKPVKVAGMLESIAKDALKLRPDPPLIHTEAENGLGLLGDYNELYSAFSNLVFNAVQYTPSDGDIHVRWYSDEKGAHLEVKDTGEGIPAHHIPRLTERFYRVDKARSRKLGGTGLGLAIVKHVVMRHDGALRVESTLHEGSTFSCDFSAARISHAGHGALAES